ncbi:MAG: hypothetical protein IMZ66_02855 [Planctomycetes bacterium]|nr:hypothetical protein [Planctomycetota bacterium]
MRNRLIAVALAVAAASLPAVASAKTQMFLETNQDQFDKGEAEGVVPTTLGTLRLGRALDTLLAETEGVDYVARLAEAPDGTVYAVTGGTGRIYRVKGGKVDLFATLDDTYLFSIAVDKNGDVYVGSGGLKGRVWRVAPQAKGDPKAEVVFEADDVKYIWDLAWMKDGALAAATGDGGKLLRITPDHKSEVLIDSEASHVLCVVAAPDGTLYAGTDGEAVVYRWADKKAFVLYDADEAEITGLALGPDGALYVGASSGAAGRSGGVTIRAEPPKPAVPVPAPAGGEAAPAAPPPEKAADEAKPDEAAPDEKKPDEAAADEKKPEAASEEKKPDAAAPAKPAPSSAALATAVKVAETMRAGRPAGSTGGAAPGAGGGSAVYRIAPDGVATPLLDARDEMILALAVADGRLLVGTGKSGRVYEVAIPGDGDDQACVASIDPKQVMALLVTKDGRTVVGSAGPGRLYALSKGYKKEGTYTSQVYDAGGSARWGALDWRGEVPGGTEVRLASRSGNVRDPKKGLWSDWSKDATKAPASVASPAARFLQFRVTMKTNKDDATPFLEQFEAAYLRANEPPKVAAINEVLSREQQNRAQALERFRQMMKSRGRNSATPQGATPPPPAPAEGSQPVRMLQWQAQDPNGDDLRYDIYFRGQGEPNWIPLDEDLIRPEYAWDTASVADGWYEIKVVASDRADHPADAALEGWRVSDPILVDNTAPTFGKIEVKVRGQEVDVRFTATDSASRLTEAAYTIDSATAWQTLGPADGLFDARQKEFRVTIRGLAPGAHRLAIRAADEAGNYGHAAETVTIGK